jgi:hypothetical protein
MENRTIKNEDSEQRNKLEPAWQPTEEQQATEKQIIIDEPNPEPTPVKPEDSKE